MSYKLGYFCDQGEHELCKKGDCECSCHSGQVEDDQIPGPVVEAIRDHLDAKVASREDVKDVYSEGLTLGMDMGKKLSVRPIDELPSLDATLAFLSEHMRQGDASMALGEHMAPLIREHLVLEMLRGTLSGLDEFREPSDLTRAEFVIGTGFVQGLALGLMMGRSGR